MTWSIALLPVEGMQNVDASTPVSACFGYVVSGSAGCGTPWWPERFTTPLFASVKQGFVVLPLQQSWLTPPLESTQTCVPGLSGSSILLRHASPVQGAPPRGGSGSHRRMAYVCNVPIAALQCEACAASHPAPVTLS